ncbi:MAG TPA: CPBP family intramembrane glutamic endopeptidase, partial [Thermoanaerobaculia bacterium]|nr:CPBP family intramembrane glutamic endopeptidase [Thermoanaerobaculia bacterium]
SAAAAAGGLSRIAWAVLALAFAPIVEEFLFRGLLLYGFTSSWGASAAAVAVTVLFVLLHLPETINYWPAIVAVSMLAIGTLAARQRTGSLFPAAALHLTYNLVLVVAVFAGMDTH